MVHGENRIPYWIDRSLPGLAGPDYDDTISFGLPYELEDSQYGESRLGWPMSLKTPNMGNVGIISPKETTWPTTLNSYNAPRVCWNGSPDQDFTWSSSENSRRRYS